MIKVLVKKQANYPVSASNIKKILREFFQKNGIVSDAEVSVAIVGKAKMMDLAQKYLKERNNIHNVLSFTPEETKGKFVYPPDNIVHLGEIVVCYQKAVEEAKVEGKLINQKVKELVEHGAFHLMGIHHE